MPTQKICSNPACPCENPQPLGEFNKANHKPSGLQDQCRTCNRARSRAYYAANTKKHCAYIRIQNAVRTKRNREFLLAHLREHPCLDCEESDIIVLEFDHVRGKKRGDVTTMATNGVSLETLQREIEKCQVVCANCHRRRTANRVGSYRLGTLG